MSTQDKKPANRLGPLSLAPLNPDDALRGAMEVPAPKDTKAKKRKKARKVKRKK